MKWLDNIKARFRWTWIGSVRGVCVWTDKGVTSQTDVVYWHLFVRGDGKRRADLTGDPKWSSSANVTSCHAAVKAWIKGGPLPALHQMIDPPKPKAKLLAFSGGKGGAA